MKILFLSTYPFGSPRHGGQIRSRHIVDLYKSLGHEVNAIGVLGSEHYPKEEGYVSCPTQFQLSAEIANPFLMEDAAIAKLFAHNDKFYSRLEGQIKGKPELIHVEQPWLFGFAKRFTSENNLNIPIVYGSQNIEYRLKRDIVKKILGDQASKKCSSIVKEIELEAVNEADAIICVSQRDLEWLKSKTDKRICLAANGVAPWCATDSANQEAKEITFGYPYALYCGSAHPPNISGFFDMFGDGFGSLSPRQRLVIAGGLGAAVTNDQRLRDSANLEERTLIVGEISQQLLEGLLDSAHCIVLPLTQGGGTNLKTAEAIWSGKFVVATDVAMRGFESFIGDPRVFVANDPVSFKKTLRYVMGLPPLKIAHEDIERRRQVLWSSSLSGLAELIDMYA